MAIIYYGVMGEGRGHSTRARALVEALRHRHQVTLFTHDEGYRVLGECYAQSEIPVHKIFGMHYHYRADNRVNYTAVGKDAIGGLLNMEEHLKPLLREIDRQRPDLVISDFEPLIQRAAQRRGIPSIQINHQHFLVVGDFKELPWRLRWWAALLRPVVELACHGQERTIVSSFFHPPKRPGCEDVLQVGVMLRPEVLAARDLHAREQGDHLTVYLRRFASTELMDALRHSGREARIYGLGARPPVGRLRFLDISIDSFLRDLATCTALVCTAGNQLVGEAQYFGKPVLAMPEPANFEQEINGWYLEKSGAGASVSLDAVGPMMLDRFLERAVEYRAAIDSERANGNAPTLAAIEQQLRPARAPWAASNRRPVAEQAR